MPEHLKKKQLPAIHQARWINTAIGIMFLYAHTKKPSAKLVRLVKITVNMYAPSFFKIKVDWHVKYAAHNLFFMLESARACLTKKELEITNIYLKRNAFYAHPEAILLAAMFDSDLEVRKWAVNHIIYDRMERLSFGVKRQWRLPELNVNAKTYIEMVDVATCKQVTEPPLLFDFTIEELESCYKDGTDLVLPDISCHNQSVERAVAATTEAAKHVIGPENRHALLLQMGESRAKYSNGTAKKENFLVL